VSYVEVVLACVLLIGVAAAPGFVSARFPTAYRGPIAWLGERLPWSARRTATTVVGLVTAVALVALLNWLFPESFGPRLSFVPALVLMLVIQASFAFWVRR